MEIDLNELHAVELRLLKAVADLCERHGLRYSIYCGTLLGAVRHGGFIPWGDDVDLQMPLKDYRRFQELAHELPEGIICSHIGNTREFPLLWTKVYAEGTSFFQKGEAMLDYPQGAGLDIYPMLGAARTAFGEMLQEKMLRLAKALRWCGVCRYIGTDNPRLARLWHLPFWFRRPCSDLLFRLSLRDPDRSERVGTVDAAHFSGKYDRTDWEELQLMPFEDASFRAPVRYDKVLRAMYGDYWKLPPPEARVAHICDDMIVDMHRDYRLYRRELRGK